jgi:GTPases
LVCPKDQLFTTLDTTVRSFRLPGYGPALLTDTVGFLRNLPPGLIAAFRATLEEVLEADALIWVVDATTSESETMLSSVETALRELGAWEMPRIIALNKVDCLQPEEIEAFIQKFRRLGEKVVPISAKTALGIPVLMRELEQLVREKELQKKGRGDPCGLPSCPYRLREHGCRRTHRGHHQPFIGPDKEVEGRISRKWTPYRCDTGQKDPCNPSHGQPARYPFGDPAGNYFIKV